MLDWNQCLEVERHPDVVSGAWVFKGTRVPVKALFDNLEDGASIGEFVDWFPGVTRPQVEAVLETAGKSLAHHKLAATSSHATRGLSSDD